LEKSRKLARRSHSGKSRANRETHMPYATAKDGTKLFYKDWGTGKPVVLVHGWPLSGDTFDETALTLADKGYRAIVPDRRGFGRSDQPWSGYDYDTFADDVAAVVMNAGVREPITLAGFSMGGGEVARFLTRHGPAQVSHAILIGSVSAIRLGHGRPLIYSQGGYGEFLAA
jgi:pimeloyl-ACP methyl ester carboxylesterase